MKKVVFWTYPAKKCTAVLWRIFTLLFFMIFLSGSTQSGAHPSFEAEMIETVENETGTEDLPEALEQDDYTHEVLHYAGKEPKPITLLRSRKCHCEKDRAELNTPPPERS